LAGRIPDTTPPGPTRITGSQGYADHIRIFWDENTEKDLGGYQIYVGLCDMGIPYRPKSKTQKESPYEPCDFSLVGELLLSEAKKRMADTGQIFYDDYSVTAGSSVCYTYWVRAFDTARNVYPGRLSGGCPDTGEYVCQKLLEQKAPPVPIISAMKARSNSVVIEWLASPLQDLKAFHVYRSERETDPPSFVASILTDGTVSSSRWKGLNPRCEDIPAEANPTAFLGSFEDKGLEPNKVYWHRVSALDWLGNESEKADITKIPAISTFTYTRDIPATPALLAPGPQPPEGCGLVVRWTPAYNPAGHEGFMVFRGPSASGPFRQVSQVVQGNEFTDTTALRGMDHYYKVQVMDRRGYLSEPSAPVLYRY
jgi:fibronectin type 3 domain-containing protein